MVVLSSGVWTDRLAELFDGGSALNARREGVTTVKLEGFAVGTVAFEGVAMVLPSWVREARGPDAAEVKPASKPHGAAVGDFLQKNEILSPTADRLPR